MGEGYTPTSEELAFIRAHARGPSPTLTVAVLLKSLQRLGYLPRLQDVPFAKRLFFGGEGLLREIHPDEQEKRLKYNHLLTNAVAIRNVIDLTHGVRDLIADGYPVKREDLAALSPYQTRHIKRFWDYTFSTGAPESFDGELLRRARHQPGRRRLRGSTEPAVPGGRAAALAGRLRLPERAARAGTGSGNHRTECPSDVVGVR